MSYDFKMQSVSDTSAILSYNIRSNPELQKYIITTQGGNTIMDLAWRKVSITEPINVDPSKCNLPGSAKIDLNHPAGILQAKYPDLLKKFDGTSAAYIFTLPILQYNTFNVSMDRWHFLFDPSGSLVQTQGTFTGNSTTKAVSVYALGESSFREGTFNPETHDESPSIDGGTVKVHSEQPPPSGQIQIAGYAKLGNSAGNDIAIVSNTAPPDAGTASGSFPFQVLMVFGGMMGAIAIFILIKARK
jgi:hypothetical protein